MGKDMQMNSKHHPTWHMACMHTLIRTLIIQVYIFCLLHAWNEKTVDGECSTINIFILPALCMTAAREWVITRRTLHLCMPCVSGQVKDVNIWPGLRSSMPPLFFWCHRTQHQITKAAESNLVTINRVLMCFWNSN